MELVLELIDILLIAYSMVFLAISWAWLGYEQLDLLGSMHREILATVILILSLPLNFIWFVLTIEYPLLCIINFIIALVLRLINNRR